MRASLAFLWIFAIVPRIAVAVRGGSQLAHNYEAIYFYYGYLADVAINGDLRTLGVKCSPTSGTVCTFLEFISSIESDFDAAVLPKDNELSPEDSKLGATTTRPGDLKELATAMTRWKYNAYVANNLVLGGKKRHSELLVRTTEILINARDNHPTVLAGDILERAKKALVYVQAERETDSLQDKKKFFIAEHDGLVIVEKTVGLENELVSFQDIDWQQSAVETASKYGRSQQSCLEGFEDFARHMTGNPNIPSQFRDHLLILQSIRTQSDSLGSVESCRAIG